YMPSAAARSLVRQRSQLIGVILETGAQHPDIQHPFFQDVLVALKLAAGAGGYDLLLFAADQSSYARRVRHQGVDGVVLMGVDARDPEVEKVVALGIPTIAVDVEIAGERAGAIRS